jgi:hypothetical protein
VAGGACRVTDRSRLLTSGVRAMVWCLWSRLQTAVRCQSKGCVG